MLSCKTLNDFQREILTHAISSGNSLNVLAKGIGSYFVLKALMQIYATDKNLVFVINASTTDEVPKFASLPLASQPHFYHVTAENSVGDRSALYAAGGCFVVSTRILIVDLLLERVPFHLVTGILVLNAESICELSNEAFILHLFREKNKSGFIKAFSESPNSFLSESFKLERCCRFLQVDEVLLWPRFHESITRCLEADHVIPIDVVEVHVEIGRDMKQIQHVLMELLEFLLKEAARCIPKVPFV